METRYPEVLKERYGVETGIGGDEERDSIKDSPQEAARILEEVAKVRGCLMKGGQYDWKKAANLMLDDYRSGKLGRITLEFPPT